MGLLTGKKGVIMGVANERSLAWGIAKALHAEGAEIAFSHLPDKDERKKIETKIKRITEEVQPKLVAPCNVGSDEDIQRFFDEVKNVFGTIDFFVHSIAYADLEEINRPTYMVSRKGFQVAMDISVYSLMATTKSAAAIMNKGGAILALTYYGGEKVITGYNVMGVCKAALDATVKYIASDLGPEEIRINAISAGPVKTLASSAVKADKMIHAYREFAPLRKSVSLEEVGKSALYLLSDLSSAVTGEIHHVDCGYSTIASPGKLSTAPAAP
jgi:enoyl-[acyl-carrier protein] reductase I